MSRSTRRPSGSPPGRGGLVDLALVVMLVSAVVGRTPVGALAWWGQARLRGLDVELPSLTATFSSGLTAAPAGELVSAPVVEALGSDQLPEPWRTALVSALATELPTPLREALVAEGLPETAEGALALADRRYDGDAERALERLVLDDALIERAVSRARAAGADHPEAYAQHRTYLPGSERRHADRLVGTALAVGTVLDLGWPVHGDPRISSGFGERVHPVLKTRSFHNGVDVAVPIGTEVVAPQAGVVRVVGENDTSGTFVVVDHGQGVRTAYCHLDEAVVRQGDALARGQLLAKSGNTGRSTGPHLHYIVRIAGEAVDPLRFRPVRTSLRRP